MTFDVVYGFLLAVATVLLMVAVFFSGVSLRGLHRRQSVDSERVGKLECAPPIFPRENGTRGLVFSNKDVVYIRFEDNLGQSAQLGLKSHETVSELIRMLTEERDRTFRKEEI